MKKYGNESEKYIKNINKELIRGGKEKKHFYGCNKKAT